MESKDQSLLVFENLKKEILNIYEFFQVFSGKLGKTGIDTSQFSRQVREAHAALSKGDFKIGVIGRFRIGKSTFLNALLGERILREQEVGGVCTAIVTQICAGDKVSAKVVYASPQEMYELLIHSFMEAGATPDIYTGDIQKVPMGDRLNNEEFRDRNRRILNDRKKILGNTVTHESNSLEFALYIFDKWTAFWDRLGSEEEMGKEEYERLCTDRASAPFIKEVKLTTPFSQVPDDVVLMDTPGLGAPNWDENITIKYLQDYHAAIQLLLPPAGFEAIDANLITHLKRLQPKVLDKMIFCINRSDEVSKNAQTEIINHVKAELARFGVEDPTVIFICSKLPFLYGLNKKGLPISDDEKEYLEYSCFKFRLPADGSATEDQVKEASGFKELKTVLDNLLLKSRATALIQEAQENIKNFSGDMENVLQSQTALVEVSGSGKYRFIERIEEAFALVSYERRKADKECSLEFYTIQTRMQNWLRTFLTLEHAKAQKVDVGVGSAAWQTEYIKKKPLDLQFFGSRVVIRDFKAQLDLACFEIFDFIDEFWSEKNYLNTKGKILDAMSKSERKGLSSDKTAGIAIEKMRDAFIPQLSNFVKKRLEVPVEGVSKDIDVIYKLAIDKIQSRLSGLTQELVHKLNRTLHIAFKPVNVDNVEDMVRKVNETQRRLSELGKASGLWESFLDWMFAFKVSKKHADAGKSELVRVIRINQEIKTYVHDEIISRLSSETANYLLEVFDNLMMVMKQKLDHQMREIRSQTIVEKFGSTREQIERNIEEAVGRKASIAILADEYNEKFGTGGQNRLEIALDQFYRSSAKEDQSFDSGVIPAKPIIEKVEEQKPGKPQNQEESSVPEKQVEKDPGKHDGDKLFMTGHSSPPHDEKSWLPPKEGGIPLQYFHGKEKRKDDNKKKIKAEKGKKKDKKIKG